MINNCSKAKATWTDLTYCLQRSIFTLLALTNIITSNFFYSLRFLNIVSPLWVICRSWRLLPPCWRPVRNIHPSKDQTERKRGVWSAASSASSLAVNFEGDFSQAGFSHIERLKKQLERVCLRFNSSAWRRGCFEERMEERVERRKRENERNSCII